MHVRRFEDGIPYTAPGHEAMQCVRLQGRDAGPADGFWIGVSIIESAGHIHPSASPQEKIYVVLEGSVTILGNEGPVTLAKWDSCRIAPDEIRAVVNESGERAVLMLAMAIG